MLTYIIQCNITSSSFSALKGLCSLANNLISILTWQQLNFLLLFPLWVLTDSEQQFLCSTFSLALVLVLDLRHGSKCVAFFFTSQMTRRTIDHLFIYVFSGEMTQWLRIAVFLRLRFYSQPTRWPTTIYNSSSRESSVLFWSVQAVHT